MSGGRAGVPLDVCVQQIASGDPYWADGRGRVFRDTVLRQIASEWREMTDKRIARLQAKMQFESECG